MKKKSKYKKIIASTSGLLRVLGSSSSRAFRLEQHLVAADTREASRNCKAEVSLGRVGAMITGIGVSCGMFTKPGWLAGWPREIPEGVHAVISQ